MNLKAAFESLKFCFQSGVREFIVCAGARNAPLVEMLAFLEENHPELKKHLSVRSFYDERGAAFYALGRIESGGAPVAVVTTSGTAVAELLPAVVEAYYQGRPLLLLTADRPKRYRGTGSPQSIEQNEIFGTYAETHLDLEEDFSALARTSWARLKPLHLNVCFEEPQSHPLLENDMREACILLASSLMDTGSRMGGHLETETWRPKDDEILWVVGPLSGSERAEALSLLQTSSAPIYAESLSGLTGDARLKSRLLFSEAQVEALLNSGRVKKVIRLGTVPTLRLWRDLEGRRKDLPVLSITPLRASWTGLARSAEQKNLESLIAAEQRTPVPAGPLASQAAMLKSKFKELAQQYPQAEPVLMDALAEQLQHQNVYVGNSLPVRNWDWVSHGRTYADIFGNRGANGIDGQISTFMGWSESKEGDHWALVGDLTSLYDLNALSWDRPERERQSGGKHRKRVVVINNGGGMIFQRIFGKELFLNRHHTVFKGWAQMFDWSYESWAKVDPERLASLPDHVVIEILPNNQQTEAFQTAWNKHSKEILGLKV